MYYADHHHDNNQHSLASSSYSVLPPPHPVKDEERKLTVSVTADDHSSHSTHHNNHSQQQHLHHSDSLSTTSSSPSPPVSLSVPWLDDDSTSTGSRDSSEDSGGRHIKRYHPSSVASSLSSRSSPFTPILDGTSTHYVPHPSPHSQQQQQQAMYGMFMTGPGFGSFGGLAGLGGYSMPPTPQQQPQPHPHTLHAQHHSQHSLGTAQFPTAYTSHSQYSNQHAHNTATAAAVLSSPVNNNMHHSAYPQLQLHAQPHPPPPPLPSSLPSASLVSYLSPAASTASTSPLPPSNGTPHSHTTRPHPSRPAAHSIPRHIRSLNQTELLDTDIHLSRTYPTLLELLTDDSSGLEHSFEWTMRHGLMPALTVRYVRDGSVEEMVKPHVEWMLEDLDRALPLLGVDAETGLHCTRLLQISTRSRCLLVRIPMQSHTHLYSTHHSHHHHHHHQVRVASSLVQLLESRVIHKSGAELWGDALDLYRDLHVTLNAALNMSWCHRRGHFSLSLEHMCNLVLGKDAFVKDKDTTLSDWDRPVLTFRQLVYGALDAQASYIVASVGEDGGGVRPTAFNCADMSSTWLSSAASWLNIVKYVQREQEVVRTELLIEAVQFVGDEMHVRLKAASSRLRWERCVYVLYADSSEELMRIDKGNGRDMVLSHVRPGGDKQRRVRSEGEVVKLSVVKERQDELLMTPVRQYLSRYMHGEEPFNPFIASILDLPFMSRPATFTTSTSASSSSSSSSSYTLPLKLTSPPHSPSLSPSFTSAEESYLSVSSAPQPWWFEDTIRPLTSLIPPSSSSSSSSSFSSASTTTTHTHNALDAPHPHPPLCAEQKEALSLLSSTRILAVTGGPGTGKCFARGTKLRLSNGDTVAVELIRGGEQLMGDDGQVRIVTPGTVRHYVQPKREEGEEMEDEDDEEDEVEGLEGVQRVQLTHRQSLYRITPKWDGASSFSVNGAHILVLTNTRKPHVQKRAEFGVSAWQAMEWEVSTDNRMILQSHGSFSTEKLAQAEVDRIMQHWQPIEWEVSVEQFLSASTEARRHCQLIACNAIRFNNPQLPSLRTVLSHAMSGVEPTAAQLDYMAWWLGMWLTNGASNCAWIEQGGVPLPDPHHREQIYYRLKHDYERLFCADVEQAAVRVCSAGGWLKYGANYGAGSVAHLVLRAYKLINNKHVPRSLICDSIDVRRHLLAGFIDGGGRYNARDNEYDVQAQHRHLIDGCKELAATLGLRNSAIYPHLRTNQQTNESYSGHRLTISGHMWDVVQYCAATYQRCPLPGTAGCVQRSADARCYGFNINVLAADEHFGFAVHGGINRRFLLEDYTVTHNVSLQPHPLPIATASPRSNSHAVLVCLCVLFRRVLCSEPVPAVGQPPAVHHRESACTDRVDDQCTTLVRIVERLCHSGRVWPLRRRGSGGRVGGGRGRRGATGRLSGRPAGKRRGRQQRWLCEGQQSSHHDHNRLVRIRPLVAVTAALLPPPSARVR